MIIFWLNFEQHSDLKNSQNKFFPRMRIELTIYCQCAKFDLNETLLGRTVYTRVFSCNSEELYEIGGGINYGVGSKIVPG